MPDKNHETAQVPTDRSEELRREAAAMAGYAAEATDPRLEELYRGQRNMLLAAAAGKLEQLDRPHQ